MSNPRNNVLTLFLKKSLALAVASAASMGWLLGATWSDREYVGQGIFQDDWDESSGIGLPVNVKNNYYIIGRERVNVNGALEFRPTDDDSYYVRGFYTT